MIFFNGMRDAFNRKLAEHLNHQLCAIERELEIGARLKEESEMLLACRISREQCKDVILSRANLTASMGKYFIQHERVMDRLDQLND